jgi:hypothetical protein
MLVLIGVVFPAQAQDLGAGFTKVKDGIYVYAAKKETQPAAWC